MRLDVFLVQNQLASSRTQAQDFIAAGHVFLVQPQGRVCLQKASFNVEDSLKEKIVVEKNSLQNYVSRAGLKLSGALDELKISVTGLRVLDVGQSTGGFTDVLLQRGAAHVTGIDVGRGQLHERLKLSSRVTFFEGLNAKDLPGHEAFAVSVPAGGFDFLVADLSFISLTKVMEFLPGALKDGGGYLFLVKPQFECGPQALDKNGIVSDPALYARVEERIRGCALLYFHHVDSYIPSALSGKDGNQEFFIYGRKKN